VGHDIQERGRSPTKYTLIPWTSESRAVRFLSVGENGFCSGEGWIVTSPQKQRGSKRVKPLWVRSSISREGRRSLSLAEKASCCALSFSLILKRNSGQHNVRLWRRRNRRHWIFSRRLASTCCFRSPIRRHQRVHSLCGEGDSRSQRQREAPSSVPEE
jgi:hypothetical protein